MNQNTEVQSHRLKTVVLTNEIDNKGEIQNGVAMIGHRPVNLNETRVLAGISGPYRPKMRASKRVLRFDDMRNK